MTDGVLSTLKAIVPDVTGPEDVEFTTYECQECGAVTESAKSQEKVQCMDCLSRDVTPVD